MFDYEALSPYSSSVPRTISHSSSSTWITIKLPYFDCTESTNPARKDVIKYIYTRLDDVTSRILSLFLKKKSKKVEFARLYSCYTLISLCSQTAHQDIKYYDCTPGYQVLWYINSTVCQALKSQKVKSPRTPISDLVKKSALFQILAKKHSFSKAPQKVVTICTAGIYSIFHAKSENQPLKRKWRSALRQAKTNSSRKVPNEIRNILSGGYFLESLLTDKPLPDKNKKYRILTSAAELNADAHWAGLITAL